MILTQCQARASPYVTHSTDLVRDDKHHFLCHSPNNNLVDIWENWTLESPKKNEERGEVCCELSGWQNSRSAQYTSLLNVNENIVARMEEGLAVSKGSNTAQPLSPPLLPKHFLMWKQALQTKPPMKMEYCVRSDCHNPGLFGRNVFHNCTTQFSPWNQRQHQIELASVLVPAKNYCFSWY